ncbi:zinc-binding dehydrogenase [Streptomyces sp. NPDC002265]|uniref:zinc-binding dehydrogenase n=1 Tax=Streptomyces sp. NPDC002265 TaxID=3154415 RepID=UPI0033261F0A
MPLGPASGSKGRTSAADTDEAAAHGTRGVFFVVEPDRTGLEAITALIVPARLEPAVDPVVPPQKTRAAYETVQTRHPRGKVVIRVRED